MKIYLATPVHYCVEPVYALGLVHLTHILLQNRIDVDLDLPQGESLITRARNRLAKRFLASSATHLMFIDSDINFDPMDVVRLAKSGHQLIGGAYPGKWVEWAHVAQAVRDGVSDKDLCHYAGQPIVNATRGDVTVKDDCLPVREMGTGFMLIARETFDAIRASEPDNWYKLESDADGDHTHNFFEAPLVDHRLLSEDYHFCLKARKVGIQPYVHIGIELGHIGAYEYRARIGLHLKPAAEAAE